MKHHLIMGAALSVTAGSLADTISLTHEFSPNGPIYADFSSASSSGTLETQFDESFWTASFDRFDPTAGGGRTLTGVEIDLVVDYAARGELAGSGMISYSFGGDFLHDQVDTGVSLGSGNGNGGDAVGEERTISMGLEDSYEVDPDLWSAMTGSGSWTWSWQHTAHTFNWTNMDPESLSLWLEEGASVTVTYTYEPSTQVVPAPSVVAVLAGLGLAGAGRRR